MLHAIGSSVRMFSRCSTRLLGAQYMFGMNEVSCPVVSRVHIREPEIMALSRSLPLLGTHVMSSRVRSDVERHRTSTNHQ